MKSPTPTLKWIRVALLAAATAAGCGSSGDQGGGAGGTTSVGSGGTTGTGSGGTTGTGSGGAGMMPPVGSSGCSTFTADDLWNKDVSGSAVDTTWTPKLQALVGAIKIHPDFGSDFGIPINVVPQSQALVPVTFDTYADESDPGPYPFPAPASVQLEGTADPTKCDGDCHLLTVQQGTCQLYEGYGCHYAAGWHCANGSKWDLTKKSYGQRTSGWTSADAAGLPIYAGLARYDEAMAGAITHAIRFTLKCTHGSFIAPATHEAVPGGCADTDPNAPPMGLRIRLKASYDDSKLTGQAKLFTQAFKKFGLMLADNGSNFFFQSEQNAGWSDDDINGLKAIPASAFEVVAP